MNPFCRERRFVCACVYMRERERGIHIGREREMSEGVRECTHTHTEFVKYAKQILG